MNENKLIVKFNGGLGNQMFQWAFAHALEKKMGIKIFLDMSYFAKKYARPYELGIFNLECNSVKDFCTKFKIDVLWRFRRKLDGKSFLGLNLYSEPCFEYDQNLFKVKPNTFIEGFFQTEKYLAGVEDEISTAFNFRPEPDENNLKMIEKIQSTNSVSLHIRRGDYVQKKHFQNKYATCSLDYYKNGVQYIAKSIENPTLFIFSDDKEWVKENLNLPYETVFVDFNSGAKSYEDLRLMSLCKHNIIANSSFSWWGAWLNANSNKIVVAPQKWFNDESINQKDVIPETWVRLEN